MEYQGFPMGSGGMMAFPGANPMMMAMQNAAFQQGRGPFQQPGFGGGGGGNNPPDRADSVFFKTRICNKEITGPCRAAMAQSVHFPGILCRWRDSECPFGEMCNFAHGEQDLRPVPPEGEEILARKYQGNPRPPPGEPSQRPAPPAPGGAPPAGQGQADRGGGNEGKQGQQGDPAMARQFFKTRFCNKFMNTGSCQYGDTCKYAHGPSDLRQPNSLNQGPEAPGPGPGPGAGQFPGQFPPNMQEMQGMYGAAMGMPGGPPLPPGAPGMSMPGMPFGPRPPPGPPPPSKAMPPRGPPNMPPPATPNAATGVMDSQQPPSLMSQHAGKPVPSVPALDRMRAMCSLLGLGPELKEQDLATPAAHAAIASIHDGSAFRDSMYADGIDRYFL